MGFTQSILMVKRKKFYKIFGLLFLFLGVKMFLVESNFFFSLRLLNYFQFTLLFDKISYFFLGILLLITSSVLFFSSFYMSSDSKKIRFFWVLLRFVLSMIFLIITPDIVFLLLGWDGLGVRRFLLIIYYLKSKGWYRGFQAFLVNRLGDAFLVLCCVTLLYQGFFLSKSFLILKSFWLSFFFLIAYFTKSAQFPFSSWLPAAMAAPTPVSALVHSSTLVTAGLYLAIRKYKFLKNKLLFFVGLIGFWTLLIARFSAFFEWDCKKIIAYSTLSQLGLILVVLSIGRSELAFFHLLRHASFKALLFICCGIIIHKFHHQQDIRFYGGFKGINFFYKIVLINALLSLKGLFFLSGFYRKDQVIEYLSGKGNILFNFLFILIVSLTAVYRCRLISIIFRGKTKNRFFKKITYFSFLSITPLWFLRLFFGYFFCSCYSYICFSKSTTQIFLKLFILSFLIIGFYWKKKMFFPRKIIKYLKKISKVTFIKGQGIFFGENLKTMEFDLVVNKGYLLKFFQKFSRILEFQQIFTNWILKFFQQVPVYFWFLVVIFFITMLFL